MKREEFKKHIRNLFYSSKTVEKYLEQAYADIDKIFDDHEAQLKAKDEEIERLKAELTVCRLVKGNKAYKMLKG